MTAAAREQAERLRKGAVDVLPAGDLERKIERALREKRPLRVKFGADPSAPDLHLGHVVVLRKLAEFQSLGHVVIFLIGDFTGMIGDPTGKSETRRALTREEVEENARSYEQQVFKVLDRDRTEVRFNSQWMDEMRAADVVRLCSNYTVARILERDDFERRMREERSIGIHEFLYPLVQGYDSVALRSDVEVGGTDQRFNLLVGRELQKAYGQEPQAILTMPLLEGTDGEQKMSKSLGNAVGIADEPTEMFGRLMSISDLLMVRYAGLLSEREPRPGEAVEAGRLHPMVAKKDLAEELVGRFHGAAAAAEARRHFELRFQRREAYAPEDFHLDPGPTGGIPLVRALVAIGFASSNGEARRLLAQRAVRVDGEVTTEVSAVLPPGSEVLVSVGKRRLARVRTGGLALDHS
jgi:tyrosyl-tRNA synthetase